MALSTQPYKGTRDFYPDDYRIREWMFAKMRKVAQSFGYQEYDGPMLESFEVYAAKSGQELVEQQLYWFMDRGERKVAIRPEMTPTFARMVAGKLGELPRPIRWFSIPNLWRYERPQRGRLREHWQLNADVCGGDPVMADAEILNLAVSLIREFGGEKHVSIKVNHRGLVSDVFSKLGLDPAKALQASKAADARPKIGDEAYVKWLTDSGITPTQATDLDRFYKMSFDEVSTKWSDLPGVKELKARIDLLKSLGLGSFVEFDPALMRGLDYYTGTVFEMFDKSPENTRAMFGGGRYDNLIGLFGSQNLSGVGLGWGDVTMRNFLEAHQLLPKFDSWIDAFVTLLSATHAAETETLAAALRAKGLRVSTPLGEGKIGNQIKLADRLGARYVILIGEDEIRSRCYGLKNLATGEQVSLELEPLIEKIKTSH